MTISPPSVVNSLLQGLPPYVKDPPIEAVCFAFGVSEDGQLGIDATGCVTTPKVLEALLGTRLRGRAFGRTPLIAGSRNSIALSADGDVFSWGWNARGTLGHGHRDPVRKPRRIAGLRGVPIVQVALGGWHTLYLDEQGQVYASGGDEYNQCGQGAQARDVLVPTMCLPTLRVCQVSAGGMHSLALTEDGQIWQWGEPWGSFSMTIDRTPRRIRPESEPEGANFDGNAAAASSTAADAEDVSFVAIACGAFHNLALTDDGRVYSWGLNDYGQLGLGHTASVTNPCRIVEGLEGVSVADISCGGWHSGLLTTAGECMMFGRGEYGRLGLGDKAGSSRLRPTKLWALEGTRVCQLSCGGSHTMAVTADGKGLAWGRGSFGRLGTGEERVAASPLEIPLPGGPERWHAVAVAAGGRHSLVYALPDTGDLDERQAGTALQRRSPMGLSPQSSTANVLARAFEAAGGAGAPGTVARRGRHLERSGEAAAAAAGRGGEATEEADDELESSYEEEEEEDSYGSSDEATMAAEAAPVRPAVVGTPVESLVTRTAEALVLGDDRMAAQMAQQEPYLDISLGRSTARAEADEEEDRDEDALEGASREGEEDEGDKEEEEDKDEEPEDSDSSEGGARAELRRAASRAAATVHGLRDDLLGDRA